MLLVLTVALAAAVELPWYPDHSRCLSSQQLDQLVDLMQNVSREAAKGSGRNLTTMFFGMGHMGEVRAQVRDYAAISMLPGISTVCEIGFNAGHSATIFLEMNSRARYIGFDMASLAWTNHQVDLVSRRYPGRFTLIRGNSFIKVPEYQRANPSVKCDVWSIDGDHGKGVARDFESARTMASPTGLVLADDYTSNFPAILQTWNANQAQGNLQSLYCHEDERFYWKKKKGWCLGRWLPLTAKSAPPRSIQLDFLRARECGIAPDGASPVEK